MTAWLHLFKKEFKHGLPALLFTLIAYGAVLVLVCLFGWKGGHITEGIFATSIIFIFPHVFYLVLYMLTSLQKEKKKLHLWLSNPMPGYQLLLAKFINGLIAMTISLIIIGGVCLITFSALNQQVHFNKYVHDLNVYHFGLITVTHIYLLAIDLGVWLMFFWVFYRMLVRRIGVALSVIVTIVAFGVITYLLSKFEDTGLYKVLTHWGKMSINSFGNGFEINSAQGFQIAVGHSFVYLGTYFFEAILCVILFVVTGWLLDRKVEV